MINFDYFGKVFTFFFFFAFIIMFERDDDDGTTDGRVILWERSENKCKVVKLFIFF